MNINDRRNVVNNVRNDWSGRHGNAFTNDWWSGRSNWNNPCWRHQHSWGRYPGRYWWRPVTAAALTGWFGGWWNEPAYYDYGGSIYYQDDSVYYGDQAVATADEYYDQAAAIAEDVPEVNDEEADWLPLGVYAVTQLDTQSSDRVLQLAVSKEGVIAGTFYNDTSGSTHPVEGSVDKKTQRAVWRITDGTNPDMVMETGIYNLTKDETEALVHFGPDQTQSVLLVRLPDPEGEAAN